MEPGIPTTQIDVVGMRDDNWTDLGECKWGPVRSPRTLEAELERKLQQYPNSRGATLVPRYFMRRKPAARGGGEPTAGTPSRTGMPSMPRSPYAAISGSTSAMAARVRSRSSSLWAVDR